MKKRKLNISKLNLNKEIISNLSEVKGGGQPTTDDAHRETVPFTYCETILGTCGNICVGPTAQTSELQQCCW